MALWGKKMSDPNGAESTASMWGGMLGGMGELMAAIQNPNFQAQIQAVLRCVIETHQRCERLEQSIHDLRSELAATVIPVRDNPARTLGPPAASGAADNGGGGGA